MSILKQKLEHYNQWLMDPKRELTAIYPGYEEPSGYTGEALGSPGLSKDLNEINDLGTGADRKVKKPNRIKELRSAQKPVALSTGAPTIDTSVKTSHTQGNNMTKVTNLSRCTAIFNEFPGAPRSVLLTKFMEELSITRSNAFVYLSKVEKAVGEKRSSNLMEGKTEESMKRKAPVRARKVNPITELSADKAAKKIAEIDAVIAGLRQSGATVSPFSGLGA
jgi:hypothetical protein